MHERLIPVEDSKEQRLLFGSMDRNLRAIRERWGVSVSVRRGVLRVAGDDEEAVRDVARRLGSALQRSRSADGAPTDAEVFSLLMDDEASNGLGLDGDGPRREGGHPRRPGDRHGAHGHGAHGAHGAHGTHLRERPLHPLPDVRPMTPHQAQYLEAIRANDVVFAVGPAGTGKTYLAVAEAVASLRAGRHRKLILTRPAVEAGERLGFLPGDIHSKINPYLRPLYDALEEMLRFGEMQRCLDTDVIEIVPLAYMRGRTLKHAFIILDEAQNTTPAQMKMFLTRLGQESKIVVTGDVTQVDLPTGATSGLLEASRILRGVKGLSVVELGGEDIIRHPMVQRIVDAYEKDDAAKRPPAGDAPAS
jgi:phosphate starvation-inducible protein PhoH